LGSPVEGFGDVNISGEDDLCGLLGGDGFLHENGGAELLDAHVGEHGDAKDCIVGLFVKLVHAVNCGLEVGESDDNLVVGILFVVLLNEGSEEGLGISSDLLYLKGLQ